LREAKKQTAKTWKSDRGTDNQAHIARQESKSHINFYSFNEFLKFNFIQTRKAMFPRWATAFVSVTKGEFAA
jgi:predicted Rossmann-fold nucleotide-binding protein